jgi:hypothetical protein
MTPCNMMGYPMLVIFGSAPPEVITTFYVPRKAPQHLYVTCIFVKEIIQIVGLQEIVHRNIVINVAPILLLVFLLVQNHICYQLHRETTKGKNSQKMFCVVVFATLVY